MKPRIKICGIRTFKDIQAINLFDISYAGFIFAESKRRVTKEQAKAMRDALRPDIKAVGVFVNTPTDHINEIIDYCQLDIAQLHGEESPKHCKEIHRAVWKCIPIQDEGSLAAAEQYRSIAGILLDTYSQGARGGTGRTFCWEWATEASNQYFTILAGGLNPENVQRAVKIVKPHVVDISSGVETDTQKDPYKIEQLVRRIKDGDQ